MHALLVAAARPNFMKVAPLLAALEARGVRCSLVHTGQHYDDAMSGSFFRDLGLRTPDVHLGVSPGSTSAVTAGVMLAFEPVLRSLSPDMVVVVGDVSSTLACALVAAQCRIPVAHVEAGLRSRDRDMPEEVHRIAVDHLSDWLLTPSADGDLHLRAEGIDRHRIFQVGNLMIDTLFRHLGGVDVERVLHEQGVTHRGFALATLHRPANVDDPATLRGLMGALADVSVDVPVLFPVHPRTAARMEPHTSILEGSGVVLVPPLGYLDMIALTSTAAAVLTDSGGIQEETTALGVPCLTLRPSTERPITVSEGTNRVVGTDPAAIRLAWEDIRAGNWRRGCPDLWDGEAAPRAAAVLSTIAPPLDGLRASRRTVTLDLTTVPATSAR